MKQKIKRAIISMALAVSFAAQPLATFPMNVFAGNDRVGVTNVNPKTGKLKIDFSKMTDWLEVVEISKVIVPLALTASLAAQPSTVFPEKSGNDNYVEKQVKMVRSVSIKNKSSIEPVFRGEGMATKTVEAPEVVIDAENGYEKNYSTKWEIVSGNDSGVVTNIDSKTGKLKIDFSKMGDKWSEVVEIKVSLADKFDSYKLAIVNAKNVDSLDIKSILNGANGAKDAATAADTSAYASASADAAYASVASAADAAYDAANDAAFWAYDRIEDLVGYVVAAAIRVAKEKLAFSAKANGDINDAPAVKYVYGEKGRPYDDSNQENAVELNRAAVKAVAKFAQMEAGKDPNNAEKAKAVKIIGAAVDACEAGAAAFWTVKTQDLGDKTKAQIAYAAYVTCEYVWTLLDNGANANTARTKAAALKPLCYTSEELNQIADNNSMEHFSIAFVSSENAGLVDIDEALTDVANAAAYANAAANTANVAANAAASANAAANASAYAAANVADRATHAVTHAYYAAAHAAYYAAAHATHYAKDAWDVAKMACGKVKDALNNGLNMESKLKTAYMTYRVAEAVWVQLGNEINRDSCKAEADKLQALIYGLYGSYEQ